MESSLDNIIKLPPILNAAKQEDALLQIYVLPAKIKEGGSIHRDSTGLIAFSDKAKAPSNCPQCNAPFKTDNGLYIPNSLVGPDTIPLPDLKSAMAQAYKDGGRPPALACAKCGHEISPYLKLREIPEILKKKKEDVLQLMVRQKNFEREKKGEGPMTEEEVEAFEKTIPLMIKADNKAFYGRILQVVNMAKDTLCDIQNFAFITLPEASKEAQAELAEGE